MATTRLIPLHVNKGKTLAQTIFDRTDYAKNPDKTERGFYVKGYECEPRCVDEQFKFVRALSPARLRRRKRWRAATRRRSALRRGGTSSS